MNSVCFTGHRKINITPELKERLRGVITYCIERGFTNFYAGGALGWDTLCEHTVLELRKIYSHIRLIIVMPCNFEEQTAKWNEAQKNEYRQIIKAADETIKTGGQYTKNCMKIRNTKLIEFGDLCICFCNNYRSGTGQTVEMAKAKPIPIVNLAGK